MTSYLLRALNTDGIGIVSFTEFIISYFVLFAALGFSRYYLFFQGLEEFGKIVFRNF